MLVRDQSQSKTLAGLLAAQRAAIAREGHPSAPARRAHLRALERMLKRHAVELAIAVNADFGQRSVHETRVTEIVPTLEAARHARRHLGRWMAPQRKPLAPYFFGARAGVTWQPLGVVGIVVPWNYPILLALQPLIGALAAGNRVMIKMSEFTPRTGHVLDRIVRTTFADDHVRVVTGGVETAKRFAALPFDHLLFTGSTDTGRSVMRAAAHSLTPLTLELGGKSPVIVGLDASVETAAARIMAGKCRNAGQSCIAPDYVLVPDALADRFIAAARAVVGKRYPQANAGPDYTSIVSDAHAARIAGLLTDAAGKGATIVPLADWPGRESAYARLLAPAIVTGVDDRMRIMHEEIFGPILPLRTYRTLDEALAYVNARPRPLALYYFGHTRREIDAVVNGTASGGVCVNDVMLQFAANSLPFGGIGASGFGAYHGADGFARFSHKKAVFRQGRRTALTLLDPPYGRRFALLLRLLQR